MNVVVESAGSWDRKDGVVRWASEMQDGECACISLLS
jgi:hypothetical protein